MKKTLFLIIGVALMAAGCSPYSSQFRCPETDPGKCVPLYEAYLESRGMVSPSNSNGSNGRNPMMSVSSDRHISGESDYQEALYGRLAGLLRDPETPMVAPPKVMRVLLLPYRGDGNELYMPRYTYFFVDEPRWILGDRMKPGSY
ncbi:TraV family lipoprotein [Geoalkalibacter halelectricus]|uniref:TraV family lipoprotein n=1 Tax=Geoalkalibacter halelectricus TaxID=2847045 RepID=UPI00266FA9BB|nr:TraV family lipoprotein [Geoalkalibacter halelectricus]MDO3380353.1 TraV family lipoprotein [Geoalkalibacter halelectricus]